jgi:hypothetical protein
MSQPDKNQTPANPQDNKPPSNQSDIQTGSESGDKGERNVENAVQRGTLRSFFDLALFFDFLLILVTAVYVFFAYHQWKAIEKQGEVMNQQLVTIKESSAQTERLIKANEELAKLNVSLVKNSGEQVKASIAQAEAATRQAQIAQQSFYIGDRPYLSANAELDKFEAGIMPNIAIVVQNNGKTPALDFLVGAQVDVGNSPKPDLKRAFTPEAMAENLKQLPYSNLVSEGNRSFLTTGEKSLMEIRGPQLTTTLIDDIKSQRRYMFVWGFALYKDGLSKRHGLRFCFFYNAIDDQFVGCPTFNSTN